MPFKVVEKQTRWGTNWTLFKSYYKRTSKFSKVERFRKAHPEFFPHYYKGHVVKAAPHSLGIMCFSKRSDAERFEEIISCGRTIIIKVKGIGKPRYVSRVVADCGLDPRNLVSSFYLNGVAPKGTVAFPAVEVLE